MFNVLTSSLDIPFDLGDGTICQNFAPLPPLEAKYKVLKVKSGHGNDFYIKKLRRILTF